MNRTQINSDLIKNEEIKTEDLADGSVTSAKLNIDANVNFNGNRIVNLGTPIQQGDAVNKQYVDNLINGLSWQKPVKQIITTFLPSNPFVGNRYLINIPNSPNINKIAEWDGTQWVYYTPEDNWAVIVSDVDKAYTYNPDLSDPFKWVLLSDNVSLPEGIENQILRHNGVGWVATSHLQISEEGNVTIGNSVSLDSKFSIIVPSNSLLNAFTVRANSPILDGWSYKRRIAIFSDDSTTNYTLELVINTQTLIASGKLKEDCGDLRFFDSSNNELPYWIESGINTQNTKIWVKIPKVNEGLTDIFMFYGNSNATYPNYNISDVFIFYDDFENYEVDSSIDEQNGWRIKRLVGSGSEARIRLLNGKKHLRLYSTDRGISVSRLIPPGDKYHIHVYTYAASTMETLILAFGDGRIDPGGNIYHGYDFVNFGWGGPYTRITKWVEGNRTYLSERYGYGPSQVYYTIDAIRYSNLLKLYRNGKLECIASDSTLGELDNLFVIGWQNGDWYLKKIFLRKYLENINWILFPETLNYNEFFKINNEGKIAINLDEPQEILDVNGNIRINNSIKFGNGVIKYDSDNKWKYSNDGINFKEIGSGNSDFLDIYVSPHNTTKGVIISNYVAGETIDAYKLVYFDYSTETWKLASCEDLNKIAIGIALNSANSGGPLSVLTYGQIYFSALPFGVGSGDLIYLSTNGNFSNIPPNTASHQVQIVGKALNSNVILFNFNFNTTEIAAKQRFVWEIIAEVNILSNMTEFTISNLSLADYDYIKIIGNISNLTENGSTYNIYFNGDEQNSNYVVQTLETYGSTIYYVGNLYYPELVWALSNSYIIFESSLMKTGNNKWMWMTTQHRGNNSSSVKFNYGFYNILTSNITEIKIKSTTTNAIGPNSKFLFVGIRR